MSIIKLKALFLALRQVELCQASERTLINSTIQFMENGEF